MTLKPRSARGNPSLAQSRATVCLLATPSIYLPAMTDNQVIDFAKWSRIYNLKSWDLELGKFGSENWKHCSLIALCPGIETVKPTYSYIKMLLQRKQLPSKQYPNKSLGLKNIFPTLAGDSKRYASNMLNESHRLFVRIQTLWKQHTPCEATYSWRHILPTSRVAHVVSQF